MNTPDARRAERLVENAFRSIFPQFIGSPQYAKQYEIFKRGVMVGGMIFKAANDNGRTDLQDIGL